MTTPETILQQLGGNKFVAMTGANTFVAGWNKLTMKLTRNQSAATHLTIALQANDLYSVTFWKLRGVKVSTVIVFEDTEAAYLVEVFTQVTGQHTSL